MVLIKLDEIHGEQRFHFLQKILLDAIINVDKQALDSMSNRSNGRVVTGTQVWRWKV